MSNKRFNHGMVQGMPRCYSRWASSAGAATEWEASAGAPGNPLVPNWIVIPGNSCDFGI